MNPTLTEMLADLAAAPSIPKRDEFYRALASAVVVFRAPNLNLPSGQPYVVQPGDNIGIPTVPGPQGKTMLLVYSDRNSFDAYFPNENCAGISGRELLEFARIKQMGIVVQSMRDGKPAWGAVLPEHVESVLAEAQQQGS